MPSFLFKSTQWARLNVHRLPKKPSGNTNNRSLVEGTWSENNSYKSCCDDDVTSCHLAHTDLYGILSTHCWEDTEIYTVTHTHTNKRPSQPSRRVWWRWWWWCQRVWWGNQFVLHWPTGMVSAGWLYQRALGYGSNPITAATICFKENRNKPEVMSPPPVTDGDTQLSQKTSYSSVFVGFQAQNNQNCKAMWRDRVSSFWNHLSKRAADIDRKYSHSPGVYYRSERSRKCRGRDTLRWASASTTAALRSELLTSVGA